MADPTRYTPGFNYSGWEADHPTEPKPGAELDNDFALIRHSIDETIRALRDVRRSDGKIQNAAVDFDALSPAVKAAIANSDFDYEVIDDLLAKDANLNDLADKAEARVNLGALGRDENLADVDDPAEALANLGGPFITPEEAAAAVGRFATEEEVKAAHIAESVESIEVHGIHAQGDMRPRSYYRGAASDLSIQSADGANWTPERPILRKYRIEDFAEDPTALEGAANADNFVRAFQRAVDHIVANGRRGAIELPPGNFWVNDELDLRGFNAQGAIEIMGAGKATRVYVTAFGCTKAVFRFSDSAAAYISVHDFLIVGDGIRNDKNSPVVFKWPTWSRASRWYNMSIWRVGNIVAHADLVGNVDCDNLEIQECGWQPLVKEVPSSARVSISGGSTTLTASEPIFSPSDVGKVIFIDGAAGSPGGISGALPQRNTIVGYSSSTQVTVQDAALVSVSNSYVSFEFVRGAINNNSRTLTLNANVLDASDEGRPIFIDYATDNGAVFATIVEEVLSPSQCRVQDLSSRQVSNAPVFFTPNIAIGRSAAGGTSSVGNIVNDISFSYLQLENFSGPGSIVSGRMVFYDHLKCHAISPRTQNNFVRSIASMIFSGGNGYFINSAQLEFGGYEYGPVWVRGVGDGLFLTNFNYTGMVRDTWLVDWAAYGDGGSILYGPGRIGTRMNAIAGLVNTRVVGTETSIHGLRSRAFQVGPVLGVSPPTNHYRIGRTLVGRVSSAPTYVRIDNNSSFDIDLSGLLDSELFGFFSFWTDGPSYWGKYWFRATADNARTLIAEGVGTANTLLEVTSSTADPDAVTVSFRPGYIRVVNRSGATRTLRWLFEA